LLGLLNLEKGKANMERMEEHQEDMPYHQYQHFVSNSPWSAQSVIEQVGKDVDQLMRTEQIKTGKPTGLLLDESAHMKKGKESVGAARQYAGIIGKVENCQVGVYASLCNGKRASLINERLFLPESWIEDEERCDKTEIPPEFREHKTKPVLALEMVDDALKQNISFDWVGGDGLYGHNYELGKGLDERHILFVLDVHKDQTVYLERPHIYLPEKQGGRGRPSSRLQTDNIPIRVDRHVVSVNPEQWQKVKVRKTAKGWLKAWIYTREVWVWDGQEAHARKRTLIVRKSISRLDSEKTELKYSLSNGSLKQSSVQVMENKSLGAQNNPKAMKNDSSPGQHTLEDFAFFQAQRYWVERNFDDAKNELGMSDYQIRKWRAWHHHHAIVLMALLFMLQEMIAKESAFPLMSVRDARIMVTTLIAQTIQITEPPMQRQIRLMKKRHKKRQRDIDRSFARNG